MPRHRRARLGSAAAALLSLLGALSLAGAPVFGAARNTNGRVGLTVSWPATTAPVAARPGLVTHSSFWVTNPTAKAITVNVTPAVAEPQNNGQLSVRAGRSAAFPSVRYAPAHFVVAPGATTQVHVTTVLGKELGPGVYLLPAQVTPEQPPGPGNIQIRQHFVALNTFQVPGQTAAHMSATFVTPPAVRNGAPLRHVAGITLELATQGRAVLQVLDDSQASFYAYTETAASQSPLGSVVFAHHTAGEPYDVRTPPALYFPGHYRDFPFTWRSSPLALGLATIHGFVSYQPGPGRLISTSAMTRVLLVSPWWGFLPWTVALASGLLVLRRIRRRRADPRRELSVPRRIGRAAGSLGALVLLAGPGILSRPLVLAACCAPGALLALLVPLFGHGRAAPLRIARAGQLVTAALLSAGAAGVVLGALGRMAPDLGFAAVTGAGLAVVATWWASWVVRPKARGRHLRGRQTAPEGAGVGA